MLFMYSINGNRPRMGLCGNPFLMLARLDWVSSATELLPYRVRVEPIK